MTSLAQLLIPALQADADGRFVSARETALSALALGVGGFVLYGGEQDAVRAFTKEMQQRSRMPLLMGADLERGAGQQFTGATGLPPLAALAWLGDAEALRRAARLTAREARTMGVNWDLAPVVDLEFAESGAMVGTRSLGADPPSVGRLAAEWITACQAEGVLACAKHFPGHGRAAQGTVGDPPVVRTDRDALHATDLVPFRAAIDAGVASMMTAHVTYPALDQGVPATYSRELLQWVLRQQFRYDNLVVGYGPAMRRSLAGAADEGEAAVRAIGAGCDIVVAPEQLSLVRDALDRALAERRLDPERVQQSVRRRLKWAQWAAPPNDWRRPTASDAAWGAQLCDRVVHTLRGAPTSLARGVHVCIVDATDAERPLARAAFADTLRTAGLDPRTDGTAATSTVVCVFPDAAAEHGEPEAVAALTEQMTEACAVSASTTVVLFSHPRLADAVPPNVPLVCAWAGDPAMQRAAARWLLARR